MAICAAVHKLLRDGIAFRDRWFLMQVCPTYFGVTSDIVQLASICHEYGAPLLVDEAHGAHFAFHASFPEPALAQDADVAIQSTHKVYCWLSLSMQFLSAVTVINTGKWSSWMMLCRVMVCRCC